MYIRYYEPMGVKKMKSETAYWLGVRDARLGRAETTPVRPYTREELVAYRQGYSDQWVTMATQGAAHKDEGSQAEFDRYIAGDR
jgi:hypothetical protein